MSVVGEMLDLSRLPPPTLLPVNYESALSERKATLKQLFDLAGIEYDLADLETDPGMIIEQADNYRELLRVAAFNDVYKQTLLAYALGANLDHLAATLFGVFRLSNEGDERFRRRVQLEAENKSGGRLGGYVAECLKASLEVADVGAWFDGSNPLQPTVRLALMGPVAGQWKAQDPTEPSVIKWIWDGANGIASSELIALVQSHIAREDVKQATDIIQVSSVSIIEAAWDVTIYHRRGPDPAMLRGNAIAALAALRAERRVPHRDLPNEAAIAAATVGGVERAVVNLSVAGVVADHGQLVHVTAITVRSAYSDD